MDNPTGLLNAVFFYNGKNFCLRGGAEHRNLKLLQWWRGECEIYYPVVSFDLRCESVKLQITIPFCLSYALGI